MVAVPGSAGARCSDQGAGAGWWIESREESAWFGGRAIEALRDEDSDRWCSRKVLSLRPSLVLLDMYSTSARLISGTRIDKKRKRPSFGSSDDEPRHWRTEKLGGRRLVSIAFKPLGSLAGREVAWGGPYYHPVFPRPPRSPGAEYWTVVGTVQ